MRLFLILLLVLPLTAEELHVNPAVGVEEIQKRVRARIAEGLNEDLHVVLGKGMYRLKKPWVMDHRDGDPSGKHKVIYRIKHLNDAYSVAAISGGVELRGWRKEADGTWTAPIPRGVGVPREMFNGTTRLTRAHYPEHGWLRVEKVGEDRRSNFVWGQYTTNLVGGRKGHLEGKDLAGAELVFLHDWSISRIEIAAMDQKQQRLTLKHSVGCAADHYAMDHFEKQPRYAIEGHPSLINGDGEWAVDGERIRYRPRREQKIAEFTPTIPRLKNLISIRGTADKPVKGIHFQGIHFAHCAWHLPKGGYASGQATIHEQRTGDAPSKRVMIPAAVTLDHAQYGGFMGCRFFMLGGNGLWLRRNCHKMVVEDVKFDDISGNALMLGDTADHGMEETSSKIRVERCVVEHCGKQYYGAVGIWAGIARELTITRNRLSHLPYTGISLGWRWSDKPSSAGKNRVTRNHIAHPMMLLSDGGGIYTLGRQPESLLAHNEIFGVRANAGRAQSNGIFMDQGSSGFTVEGNLIHNVEKSPLRFHRAKENIVLNNCWVLKPGIEAIRYNNTKEDDVLKEGNKALDHEAMNQARREMMQGAAER